MAETEQTRRGPTTWIALGVVAGATVVALVMWLGAGHESTDDAQIEGRITQISTRVGGPILELHVTDNQFVAFIFAIDDKHRPLLRQRVQPDTAQHMGDGKLQ